MSDDKPNSKTSDAPEPLDSRILAAVRGLMVLLVPLGGIIGAYYSTRAAIESDLRSIRERADYDRETTRAENDRIRSAIDNLESNLHAHTTRGPDGLAHPEGIIVKQKIIESRIKALEDSRLRSPD